MTTLQSSQRDVHCHSSLTKNLGVVLLLSCILLLHATKNSTILVCGNARENKKSLLMTNNSKTAVCVSGQLRTLTMQTTDENHPKSWGPMRASIPFPNQTVAESIQRNLYPKLNKPDVFMVISTRQTEREPKQGDLSVCEPLRPEGGYLSCSVPLEKPMESLGNESFWNDFRYPNYVGIQGLLQQMKGMYDCYKQIERHSILSGKKYEWIVRLRPDIYVYEFPNIEDLNSVNGIDKKIFNGNRTACCCGNEDSFAIGKYNLMVPFLERLAHLQHGDIFSKGTPFTSESHLLKYMRERGVSLQEHPMIKTCLVKPKYRKQISEP